MRGRCRHALFALLLGLVPLLPLAAQAGSGLEPAQILILGTYHFANPGRDIVKTEVTDILSPASQDQVGRVVDALARFRPTKIAIERLPAAAGQVDSVYAAYRHGTHSLSRSETQQLGFRLAARLGHRRLYPIDHGGEFPFEAMMQYAQAHDTAFVRFVGQELARITAEADRQQRDNSVGEILRQMNDPETLAGGHGTYVRFAQVGAADTYVGADLLAKWYERNIRIFANLQRLVEPGDRILVLYGAGHAPILRELVTYHPAMILVDPLPYLPPN